MGQQTHTEKEKMNKYQEEQGQLDHSAVEALHQTMVVLREELDRKNIVIRKLRKRIRKPEDKEGTRKQNWVVNLEDSNLNVRNSEEFACLVGDLFCNSKLTVKQSKQTHEEDSMFGDGDSETESETHGINHDSVQEDSDVLEVFRDMTVQNMKE